MQWWRNLFIQANFLLRKGWRVLEPPSCCAQQEKAGGTAENAGEEDNHVGWCLEELSSKFFTCEQFTAGMAKFVTQVLEEQNHLEHLDWQSSCKSGDAACGYLRRQWQSTLSLFSGILFIMHPHMWKSPFVCAPPFGTTPPIGTTPFPIWTDQYEIG